MEVLRFFIGRGELANTVSSALCRLCLNLWSFHILVKEFVSVVTTTIGIVIRHAAAVAALQRINLMFWLLVGITRWIFTPRFFGLGESMSLSHWLRSLLRPRPSRRLRPKRSGEYDVFLESELRRFDLVNRILFVPDPSNWMNTMMTDMKSFSMR